MLGFRTPMHQLSLNLDRHTNVIKPWIPLPVENIMQYDLIVNTPVGTYSHYFLGTERGWVSLGTTRCFF